jgi:hypothetical protein
MNATTKILAIAEKERERVICEKPFRNSPKQKSKKLFDDNISLLSNKAML